MPSSVQDHCVMRTHIHTHTVHMIRSKTCDFIFILTWINIMMKLFQSKDGFRNLRTKRQRKRERKTEILYVSLCKSSCQDILYCYLAAVILVRSGADLLFNFVVGILAGSRNFDFSLCRNINTNASPIRFDMASIFPYMSPC